MLANVSSNAIITGAESQRHGNAHPSIVPYEVFPTADGELFLAVGNDLQWRRLAANLAGGIKAGRTVLSIVDTLRRCGDLLERHGVAPRDDDTDELADEPRVEER